MNTKARLERLEATTKAQQATTQGAPSTPATRLQALHELDTWRATLSDDAAMLTAMHDYSARRLQLTDDATRRNKHE